MKKSMIFFFDPPYADKKFVQNLFSLKKSKIFKKKHLIIIHRERNSEDNYENIIDLIILKKYGRSKIILDLLFKKFSCNHFNFLYCWLVERINF